MHRLWLSVLLFPVLLPSLGWAELSDVGLPIFPQGQVEKETRVQNEDVRVLLGAPREVRGELRAREEIRRELSGQRRMISAGREHNFREVVGHYEQALQERQATTVFSCDGRSCGSSNVWANRVFGESRLYGRDDEQAYRVSAWRDSHNRIQLNSLYMVQRGNREVSVYEQSFRLGQNERLDGVEIGERRLFGPVIVPWKQDDVVSLSWSEPRRQQVLELVEEYPEGRLFLVGFAPLGDRDFDDVMATTELALDKVKAELEEAGVDPDRIRQQAVGPLVSGLGAGREARRVEVTLIRKLNDE